MRKFLASIGVACLLGLSLFVASPVKGSVLNPQTAGACSQTGWYVVKYSVIKSESYYSYSYGKYGYIYFQEYLQATADNCYVIGNTRIWLSLCPGGFGSNQSCGDNLRSFTIRSRVGSYGGSWYATPCNSSNATPWASCFSPLATLCCGDVPSNYWADSYDPNVTPGHTYVVGPYGGSYGGPNDYVNAG